MYTMRPPGRPRTLDRNKKRLFCDAVSRGASMTEAALTVGVSLRTVQREARLDPHFDQELRSAHTDKPDPLAIMQSAARTHWRAAAWLLERTQPEDYGRRPASSCSPYQFEEALKVVIDAALRLAPPEHHARVYAELTAASATAFKAVFPNYGPYGRHLVSRLPNTPLADAQRLEVLGNPPPNRIVPDRIDAAPEVGWLDRTAATHQAAPDPFAAPYLHPRALPEAPPASQQTASTPEPAMSQASGARLWEASPTPMTPSALSDHAPPSLVPSTDERPADLQPAAAGTSPSPPAPEGRRNVARGASPWTIRRNKPKSQRGDVAPASWPSKTRNRSGRVLRPIASRTAPTFRKGRRILTPKTRLTTKQKPSGFPIQNAPVSREAVAERAPAPRPQELTRQEVWSTAALT